MIQTDTALPDKYVAALSPETAETGIRALQANALRLVRDARLLFHARRHASAAMLATTAIDELARIPLLLDLGSTDAGENITSCWQQFREGRNPFPWGLFQGGGAAEDAMNDWLGFVGAIGQRVECFNAIGWLGPEQIIARPLAKEIIDTAEMFAKADIDPAHIRAWLDIIKTAPADIETSELLARFRAV